MKRTRAKDGAIKTGLGYILQNDIKCFGIITADCDGQHSIEDIEKCVIQLQNNPESFIIGCRNLNRREIPFKSYIGNKVSRYILKRYKNIDLSDTQSGLRAYGRDKIELFSKTAGERYEYETNMLIDCVKNNINIQEVQIQTIYLNNNGESHFKAIRDSIRIYKTILKK